MLTHMLLHGILLPGLAAAAVAALLSSVRALRAGAAGAVGLALAYVLAHRGLTGWHGLLPVDVTHRLPLLALLAGTLGLGSALPTLRAHGALLPAAVSPLAGWALLTPLGTQLTTGAWLGVWAGLTAALLVLSVAWSRVAHDAHPVPSGLALVVSALGLGAASVASGSVVLGQLSVAIAVATGAVTATAWLARRPSLGIGPTAGVAGLLLGGVAILAGAYSTTSAGALGLWALTPVAILGVRATVATGLRPATAGGLTVVLALAASGATAAWAATAHVPSDTPTPSGTYDYGYGDE